MEPMVLYLCQHGDALAKDVDPDRPLSEQGITEVCNVANALHGVVEIDAVLHSGKTRARQTAELLHERLAPDTPLAAGEGLGATDPVEDFAAQLASRDDNLMLVGHMPFVSRLASRLLGLEGEALAFRPGTVAALDRDWERRWTLAWMLPPAVAAD